MRIAEDLLAVKQRSVVNIPGSELPGLAPMSFRDIAKKIPIVRFLVPVASDRSGNTRDIFTKIYRNNWFNGRNSVSGPGSEIEQTRVLIEELPRLFADLDISTLLDIPCGDFHWMNNV